MKTVMPKIFWFVALIVWMSLMFYLSGLPGLSSGLSWDFVLRKIAHMAEYGVLTFLVYKNLKSSFKNFSTQIVPKTVWPAIKQRQTNQSSERFAVTVNTKSRILPVMVFVFTLLYAASDEWHQSFIASRHGTPFDLVYDGTGSIIVIVLISHWPKLKNYFLSGKK